MSEVHLEFDMTRADRSVTLRVPTPFTMESDQLDVAMAITNTHFGDPEKNIGGPRLPTKP